MASSINSDPTYPSAPLGAVDSMERLRRAPDRFMDTGTRAGLAEYMRCMLAPVMWRAFQREAGATVTLTLHPDGSLEAQHDAAPHSPAQMQAMLQSPTPGPRSLCLNNALSDPLVWESRDQGRVLRQTYAQGQPLGPVEEVAYTDRRGERLLCRPDPALWRAPRLKLDRQRRWFQLQAALHPGLRLRVRDVEQGEETTYCAPRGLEDLAAKLLGQPTDGLPSLWLCLEGDQRPVRLQAHLVLCAPRGAQHSAMHGDLTPEGGLHLRGVLRGLRGALEHMAPALGLTLASPLSLAALSREVALVVALSCPREPQYGRHHLRRPEPHDAAREEAWARRAERALVAQLADHHDLARRLLARVAGA
jgi:hypothetical protein